jgi:hypothetical protein
MEAEVIRALLADVPDAAELEVEDRPVATTSVTSPTPDSTEFRSSSSTGSCTTPQSRSGRHDPRAANQERTP